MPKLGEIRSGKELGIRDWAHKYIWFACPKCGKERWLQARKGKPKRSGLCRPCAMKEWATRSNIGQVHKGNKYNWKGGRYKDAYGYIHVYVHPNDFFYPMATKMGYVREHRLVVAKHLKRCLLPWEVVHHKGIKYPSGSIENRGHNRLENLELLPTQRQHIPSTRWQRELKRRDKQIEELGKRVTLLEAENTQLREQAEEFVKEIQEKVAQKQMQLFE